MISALTTEDCPKQTNKPNKPFIFIMYQLFGFESNVNTAFFLYIVFAITDEVNILSGGQGPFIQFTN